MKTNKRNPTVEEILKKDKEYPSTMTIIFIFYIILSLSLLLYIKVSLTEEIRLMQEEINYIYTKENIHDTDIMKLKYSQEILLMNITEIKFDQDVFDNLRSIGDEKPAPFNHIEEGQILVTGKKVIIKEKGMGLADYADTNSMSPILTSSANGIEIKPKDTSDIHVGDIISYYNKEDMLIVHRVVRIGIDEEGWYTVTKADNAEEEDPNKIRFDHIYGILVAVVY